MMNSKITLLTLTLALTGLGGCDTLSNTASTPAAEAVTAVQVDPAVALVSGSFSGRSDHITTGTASVIGAAGRYSLVLSPDFELDGAPDPIVGFGNNGTFDIATKLGSLQNRTGAQTYSLPADFDPAANSEVYVWCEKFAVPLGVATLK